MECKCRLVDKDPFGQFKFCLKEFGSIKLLEIGKTVNMELSERESKKKKKKYTWNVMVSASIKKMFSVRLYSLLYPLS